MQLTDLLMQNAVHEWCWWTTLACGTPQLCLAANLSCEFLCLQDAVKQYSAVFSWLLCLKRVALLSRQLWQDLASMKASSQRSSQQPVQSSQAEGIEVTNMLRERLRILQLFRHEAAHLTAALQAYMQGQLLGECWTQLEAHIKVSLLDMMSCLSVNMRQMIGRHSLLRSEACEC